MNLMSIISLSVVVTSYQLTQIKYQKNDQISVITYNILENNKRGIPDIIGYILESNAEIVFIQESEVLFGELDQLAERYPYSTHDLYGCLPHNECDTLLMAQQPITLVSRDLVPGSKDRFIHATTIINGDELHLIAVHFDKLFEGSLQRRQMEAVSSYIQALEGPVLLAGDFNAVPWMPVMRSFLKDAGLQKPFAYRPTWPIILNGVGLPIDHILTNQDLEIRRLSKNGDAYGSNHYPLVARVRFLP